MQITNSLQKSRPPRTPDHHPMDLIFYVDKTEIARAACSVADWDGGETHGFTGMLNIGKRAAGGVIGRIAGVRLPRLNRGGAPKKKTRNIAVYLASYYFDNWGNARRTSRCQVLDLWRSQRAESVKKRSDVAKAHAEGLVAGNGLLEERKNLSSGICNGGSSSRKDRPRINSMPKETHQGITSEDHVSRFCTEGSKCVQETQFCTIGFGGTEDGIGRLVILLEHGACLQRIPKHPEKFLIQGPHWVWQYGEENAEHFCDRPTEILSHSAIPEHLFSIGNQVVKT